MAEGSWLTRLAVIVASEKKTWPRYLQHPKPMTDLDWERVNTGGSSKRIDDKE